MFGCKYLLSSSSSRPSQYININQRDSTLSVQPLNQPTPPCITGFGYDSNQQRKLPFSRAGWGFFFYLTLPRALLSFILESFPAGYWPRQMSPSSTMICLQALQCLVFLKVFSRKVWEWIASSSSGCGSQMEKKKKRKTEDNVSFVKSSTGQTVTVITRFEACVLFLIKKQHTHKHLDLKSVMTL